MNICVYGAASNIIDNVYINSGEKLGKLMAQNGYGLVFGGGANGMMGAVARGVHSGNGEIIGVTPRFFDVDGVLFEYNTELIRCDTMRERKQIMEDRSDAFVMTPGGIGTYEEFFEIFTLKQLSRHTKPIIIFNINGYYDLMLKMLENTVEEKFMHNSSLQLIKVCDTAEQVIECLQNK